MIVRPN